MDSQQKNFGTQEAGHNSNQKDVVSPTQINFQNAANSMKKEHLNGSNSKSMGAIGNGIENHNPIMDPAVNDTSYLEKKSGPDFKRGRSFAKQVLNNTNLESIHSSQSMIAVEHENKGDVYNAQLQRGRIKIITLENLDDTSKPSFEVFKRRMTE